MSAVRHARVGDLNTAVECGELTQKTLEKCRLAAAYRAENQGECAASNLPDVGDVDDELGVGPRVTSLN